MQIVLTMCLSFDIQSATSPRIKPAIKFSKHVTTEIRMRIDVDKSIDNRVTIAYLVGAQQKQLDQSAATKQTQGHVRFEGGQKIS
jgi:hypothetical protein